MRSILSFDVDLICSRAALSGETFFLGAATRHGGQAMRRCYSGTFETNSITLIGDFVFGSIGFVAFICVIGAFETAALLFLREQRDILDRR